MKSKLYLLLISSSSLLLFSCKTASKMYEKGNYDEAVELAAKKLQKDPNDPKLQNIIRESYQYALNDHQSQIRAHSESSSESKWEWIYYDYAALQKMYTAIYKVPSLFSLVNPVDYSNYLVTYAEKAGDVRFSRGMDFMQRNDKQSYRNAYKEFKAATGFKPADHVIRERMDEAYQYAVTNVIILPMQQYGGYVYSGYNPGNYNLDDQLINSLRFNTGNEFLKFYSAWDARSKNIRNDVMIDMQMATVNIGQYRDHKTSNRVSKEVLVKETVIRPDSIVKEYATVYADITTTRRTLTSDATLRVNARNATGQWIWNDAFHADYAWNTEFSTYTGDARALSYSDKELVNRRQEDCPSESEIMRCLVEKISNDAESGIRNYFSSY